MTRSLVRSFCASHIVAMACCGNAMFALGVETWDLTDVKIVLPQNPNVSQKLGAYELCHHLKLIADADCQGKGHELVFAVPPGEKLAGEFESHCRIVDGRVYFWGDDSFNRFGSLFGAYAFLKKQLRVDWVFPGEEGIVFHPMKQCEMPLNWHDVYRPPLTQTIIRNYSGLGQIVRDYEKVPAGLCLRDDEILRRLNDIDVWYRRHRLQTRSKPPYGHAFGDWQDRFYKTHPEWLCQAYPDNPERGLPHDSNGFAYGKLCVSNEGVVDQIVADWEQNGTNKHLNVCENDGYYYCRCAACKSLDNPLPGEDFNVHKTDRYLNFWNRIASKARAIRPDVVLSAYLYAEYRLPPRRERIAYAENMYFGWVPSLVDDNLKLLEQWNDVGLNRFFIRPNFLAYMGMFPRGCERAIYENFHLAMKFGAIGVDYDGYPGRYATSPEYYVVARMIVNPKTSFGDIIADYCQAFGEAGPVVDMYLSRVRGRGEKMICRMREAGAQSPSDGTYDNTMIVHTLQELKSDRDFLAKADAELTFSSPSCAKRFSNMCIQAEHFVRTAEFYAAVRSGRTEAADKAGESLLAFRVEHFAEMPDFYGAVFGSSFACGEAWAWKDLPCYRKCIGKK